MVGTVISDGCFFFLLPGIVAPRHWSERAMNDEASCLLNLFDTEIPRECLGR